MNEQSGVCPSCGWQIDISDDFCRKCGTKLAVKDPVCEEESLEAIAECDLGTPSGCEKAWQLCTAHLKRFKSGQYVVDVSVTAEVAKAALALLRLQPAEPDYSLGQMKCADDTLPELAPELPPKLATGMRITQLDDAEVDALAEEANVRTSPQDLQDALNSYQNVLIGTAAAKIVQLQKAVVDRYAAQLGEAQVERHGMSGDLLQKRAEAGYAQYKSGQLEPAIQCFRDLAELAPKEPYAHKILSVLYLKGGEHEKALEEALYASHLDPQDLEMQINRAIVLRRLGLYAITFWFASRDETLGPEDLDALAPEEREKVLALWKEQSLATKVWLAVMGSCVVRVFRTNQWSSVHALHLNLQEKFRQDAQAEREEASKKEQENESRVQRLEGASVFVSYRRSDSKEQVDELVAGLKQELPDVYIYRDVSSLKLGEAWSENLEKAVKNADLVLVVIGPGWLGPIEGGRKRMEQPTDVLRRELVTALRRNDVDIVPVLVRGAAMPGARELPSDVAAIRLLQAIELRSECFSSDAKQLVQQLKNLLGARVAARIAAQKELDDAMHRTGGRLGLVLDKVFYSDPFDEVGRWECRISGSESQQILFFTVKHDHTFKGTCQTDEGPPVLIEGNVSKVTDVKQVSLSLRLEGISGYAGPFVVVIPIERTMGEGYQGTDTESRTYFLRLVERTRDGLAS